MPELSIYHCSSCGAELISNDTISATFCLYCRNHNIIKTRFSGKFKPGKIIPFKINKTQAKKIYKKWIRKKIFAPKIFRNKDEIDKITGLYAPYWIFDCIINGYMDGIAYKTYENDLIEKRVFRVTREANFKYNKIPVDGSLKLDDRFMLMVEPFDYNEMVDFSMEYMSGFFAEKYDVEVDEAEGSLIDKLKKSIEDRLEKTTAEYSSFTILNKSISLLDVSYQYVMLPIYLLNNKYNGNDYMFIINGQTGKVEGYAPYSKKRSIILNLILFIIVWVIFIIGGVLFE